MHRHPDQILARRTPVAKLVRDADGRRNEEINADFWNLWHRYKELGILEPSMFWLARTCGAISIIGVIMVYSCLQFPDSWFFNGMLVGNFWIQAGFLTHDAMHRIVHPSSKISYAIGYISGNVLVGVNTANWL